ncbi:MAG TPA: Clp protease N-terminal domain-containing protein [Terracidiphilus sp.]|jgi:ATP-dependent Clp protease ATP-binding subunit ClpC|nr:Clp protease N-terminal domain-containing protein [Terracidiphilus sp.]
MFERYNEKARRVIFFARYEASQFGSPYIETEHVLLGLLREDKALTNRFLRSLGSFESIHKQIEAHAIVREKISTSVDLPLSNECKRVLAYAAEEAERLGHKHIGTEHLFLGLLREENSFAAQILKEREINLQVVRDELAKAPHVVEERRAAEAVAASEIRDLTQAALEGQLEPVIGRNLEVEAAIEVLSKFQNGNLVLVGEPGAGKTAIVEALAQRIADGSAPSQLTGKRVLVFDRQLASGAMAGRAIQKVADEPGAIVFVGDLRSLLEPGFISCAGRATGIIRDSPHQDQIRCIATSTQSDYEECLHVAPWLRDVYRAVFIRPLDEDETLSFLNARKARYESFHEVSYSDEALRCAVESADRYLRDHALPGKALELIDAAAVCVKLRQAAMPEEIRESQKRIRFIVHRMDSAIGNHEFEKAKFYSEEEKKERENLRALREKYHLDEIGSNTVRQEDVEAVIARWSEYPFQPLLP